MIISNRRNLEKRFRNKNINDLDKELARDVKAKKVAQFIAATIPPSDDQYSDGNTHTLYTVDINNKKCKFIVVTDEKDIIKKITQPLCKDAE